MKESSLQSKILKYINNLPEGIAENVSGGANQSGRADINACYKGRCMKIELKRPASYEKPSLKQEVYLRSWKRAGAMVLWCSSLEEVKRLIAFIDEHTQ